MKWRRGRLKSKRNGADYEADEESYDKLKEYMQTDEYVEDVARSQLGLIYPDEIVVKPEE